MTIELRFHSDPGHGWLEVSLSTIRRFGFQANDFSIYSYVEYNPAKGWVIFLEEDCDATKLLQAIDNAGLNVKDPDLFDFKEVLHRNEAYIRDLESNPQSQFGLALMHPVNRQGMS